jgi:hypothetical protein
MINPFQVLYGLLITSFIPGYTLVQALFPRKRELDEEYDTLYRITLAIAFSWMLVIFVGFFYAHPSVRWFKEPGLSLTLIAISCIFFYAGWYKGAYQTLGVLVPRLARAPPGVRTPLDEFTDAKELTTTLIELKGLSLERRQLSEKVRTYERKEKISSLKLSSYYKREKEKCLKELMEVNRRIDELEKKRDEERQEG